jgi:phosphoribosylformylglycinamidine synthase
MKAAVVVFPASNCDRDAALALEQVTGEAPAMVWHGETDLPPVDLIVLPGGFSYGDYLRCGAMAANSPIMRSVAKAAGAGRAVLGICNGFQILTESGLLPGALMRNRSLKFVCRTVPLAAENGQSPFTRGYSGADAIRIPVAHHDGCYYADDATLDRLEGEGQIAFRYAAGSNPNGSVRDIAGILNGTGRVLGLMPHPERAVAPYHPSTDGLAMFRSLLETLS